MKKKPTMLMILDGFGKRDEMFGNAIQQAHKPNLDQLFATHPTTQLGASGLSVGLPEGQMGNSEVGHLNIGAGRIVYQELTKITKEIEEGKFFRNAALNACMDHVKEKSSSLHLIGLLSDGGVHSHISHIFALLDLAKEKGLTQVYVHGLLDGRDVPPRCAAIYIQQLEDYMKKIGLGSIASITGRYYAMDRDNRWERVQLAYDILTQGNGQQAHTAMSALEAAYERGENDEFVKPTAIVPAAAQEVAAAVEQTRVQNHDGVIFFNFRPDRAREITRCFVDPNFSGFQRQAAPTDLCYVCLTQYDAKMPNVLVAFPPQSLSNTLGEYLSDLGLTQLRIAETEKYAHVTFFFNGGIETPYPGEDRILIPSPKVATYDLKPEMSAIEVTDKVVEKIQEGIYDVIILNYANPDMVGHTGVFEAARAAIEALDVCVGRVVEALLQEGGQLILTADHGNADEMLDEDGNVLTAHSLNPVPLLVLSRKKLALKEGGVLADLAPTLMDLMGIPQPPEMTGHSLISAI